MNSAFEKYISLMGFISKAIGPDFEISLLDTRDGKNRIIAMEYGNLSESNVSEDICSLALKVIENKEYVNTDYIANRVTYSKSGKPLRTSMFFIKDEKEVLQGVMIIKFDDTRYEEFGKKLMFLCHPDKYIQQRIAQQGIKPDSLVDLEFDKENQGESMTIEETIESIIDNELKELLIPVDRLTQDEKIKIVKNLDSKGVFMMKGAVGIFSKKFDISQASVYRYINLAREE